MADYAPLTASRFDPADFARLLAHSGSNIPALREAVKAAGDVLNEQFRAGRPVAELVPARALMVDDILRAVWAQHGLDRREDLALVAVGGYGRGELHPHSDIDLLILQADDSETVCNELLPPFITLLWDLGLEIGHSVRTVDACVEEAAKDISVASNLMESRLITGSDALFRAMRAATGPDRLWNSRDFYRAKWEEQIIRHQKYANTEYNLEPNIKSGPGGLRDIQMIGWIAKRHFNTDNLDDLVPLGLLTGEEMAILKRGRDYLWKVRWSLHLIAGRAEDRLLFDYQRSLAALNGYQDSEEGLAVEQYMQQYYRWSLILAELNDLLMQLFDETILRACEPEQVLPINQRFRVRNNYLEACNDKVFTNYPPAILEAFVLMAQNENIIGPRANTIRLIRQARRLIDDRFRADPRNRTLFMELLRSRNKLATQLRRMNRYGILGRYLPEFGRIVGKMQHDLFHIYTVDAHTIQVVKNMRLFGYSNYSEKFPVAAAVVKRLQKPELLYIAGLYHDIAKGRGGDHSDLGAQDAEAFCRNHGVNRRDTQLVTWLVKNHLVMSGTSQRKDISDPEVIRDFALQVGDQTHLDYLYALTVADIYATDPKLWTTWRASLLRQLYLETKRVLRRGLEGSLNRAEWVAEGQEAAIRILEDDGYDADEVLALWGKPADDYFLRENPADIAWHTRAVAQCPDGPVVLIRNSTNRLYEGATQVFVYTRRTPELFARTAALFEQLGLSIQDARIYNNQRGFAMDTYIALDANNEPIGNDTARLEAARSTLLSAITRPDAARETVVSRHIPRKLKHFSYPTDVHITLDEAKNQTVVEVISPDRPGLLARIGKVFVDHGVELQNAKISTLGERVEDVFFITDRNGNAVQDQAVWAQLQQAICQALDQQRQG